MKKTSEHIRVKLLNGKEQKRTVYTDENGKKYVYNQNGFIMLDEFVKNRTII